MGKNLDTKYDPAIHHRHSIRLKEYNYSQAGAYFVTICTQGRKCLFGNIVGGEVILNDVGKMVRCVWDDLPVRFPLIELDVNVIMPNHMHGIIIIHNGRGESCIRPENDEKSRIKGDHKDRPYGTMDNSVGRIIQAFKSITTHRYTIGVKQQGLPSFRGRLWQRNYYEHIIRNENKLNRIREYILYNPMLWQFDRENTKCIQDKTYDKQWGQLEDIIYGKRNK